MKRVFLLLLLGVLLLFSACTGTVEEIQQAPPAPNEPSVSIPVEEPNVPAEEPKRIGISMPTDQLQRWKDDGERLEAQLSALGYETELVYAQNDFALQNCQLEAMTDQDVLIVAAVDFSGVEEALQKVKAAGCRIICYDRLVWEPEIVDYYCGFDPYGVGRTMVQYLIDTLDLEHEGTHNAEYFAPDRGDGNWPLLFLPDLLEPYLKKGTLQVPSGQITIEECATENWDSENARMRMETLLSQYYADGTQLDAVFCCNDSLAQGVIEALDNSGYQGSYPIITGQDCAVCGVKNLLAGKQSMSLFKSTQDLADAAVQLADTLLKGEVPTDLDPGIYGCDIPSRLVQPRVVTKENWKELLVDTGCYTLEELGIS